jgi:hypothetical protein
MTQRQARKIYQEGDTIICLSSGSEFTIKDSDIIEENWGGEINLFNDEGEWLALLFEKTLGMATILHKR